MDAERPPPHETAAGAARFRSAAARVGCTAAAAMLLRPCVICVATGAVIAMSFSLWFLIAAFTEYRAPDFKYASFSTDLSTVTTCMESINQKTLEKNGWHKLAEDDGCDEGKRDALAAALRVSVHPLVHAWQSHKGRNDNVSLALGFVLPSIVMPPEQWAPTRNEKNGGATHIRFQDKSAGWDESIPQIHAERIYAALETLAGTAAVPSENGCRLTYPTGAYDEEYAIRVRAAYNSSGDTQVPVHDIATTCAGSNPPDEQWKTTSGGVDTRVIWGGLAGDYAAVDATASSGFSCPGGRSTGGFRSAAAEGDLCFSDAERDLLYTHCVLQFRFGSSGEESATGMPDVNVDPQPMLDVSDWVDGAEDAKTDYTTRVRLLLGTKFGNAVAFYTVMLALCAFLLADAFVTLLVEVTYPERLQAIIGQTSSLDDTVFDILRLRATMTLTRGQRFVLAIVAAIIASFSFAAFRNDFTPNTKRPHCAAPDAATADDDASQIGWHSVNSGGWQTDAMPAYYEELALIFAWAVVVLLPLAELFGHYLDKLLLEPLLGCINSVSSNGFDTENKQALDENQDVSRVSQARPVGGTVRLIAAISVLAVVGTLALIIVEANVAGAMGVSWAEGLIGLTAKHVEYYDSHLLFGLLYRQALLTGAVAITAGWVSGSAVAGFGLQGVGGVTLVTIFLWLLVTAFGFLPLLLYRDIVGEPFDQDDSFADCKKVWWDPMLNPTTINGQTVYDGGWREDMNGESVCVARYGGYIAGVVLLLLAFLFAFLFMLFVTIKRCSAPRDTSGTGEVSDELKEAFQTEGVNVDSRSVVRVVSRIRGGGSTIQAPVPGAHVSLQSVRVRPNAKASAARYAPALRAGVASIERPACTQVLPTVASGAERHQERLAALLLGPQGQAASSVPLMAVSRR